ncbi:hypothetical protein GCM10009122_25550 [Fulvivirga kasyanovii]|uniref:Fe2OG dioxygenase domain-containing protein n=1 Tax=Fulvivirga kasyanovii TaxID=396812 RepID=A0ABW9RPI9_9BACT|nr:hypothetical protein [Fulvivirga kasyanovii]MTI26057.1 hypothetical protein [Fulvivirga kasyanovii]
MSTENQISKSKNALLVLPSANGENEEIKYLKDNFCGEVFENPADVQLSNYLRVYACGDLEKLEDQGISIDVIEELSSNYENLGNIRVIKLGQVPVVIHDAGVYFRDMFDDYDYFNLIQSEHVFQELTESTKQSKALRKGIYLSPVSKEATNEGEVLHYRLLRCSSNLTGPTDNFRKADHNIVDTLNDAVRHVFDKETQFNHVLAQVYENQKSENGKEAKAKIKAHSDKTKDMPLEGLIAFCTFYDQSQFGYLQPSQTDRYDWCYKKASGLTRLLFKLKNNVQDTSLVKEFSVTLYPNSVFLIPLSTNRLYTHEIRPSTLNVDMIPVRMGYVARCSNLEAVYKNDEVFIKENGELLKLEPMTEETMGDLRNSYYKENISEEMVEYGKIRFSMNSGDYKRPIY